MDDTKIRKVNIDELEKLRALNTKIMVNNPKYDEDLVADFTDTEKGTEFFREAIKNKVDGESF